MDSQITIVVVAGKHGILVAQREYLFVYGVEETFGAALLKVGASATTYEQGVAREHDLGRVAHERHAAVRVPRSRERVQGLTPEFDLITLSYDDP